MRRQGGRDRSRSPDNAAAQFSADIGRAMERWARSGATLVQVRDALLRYAAQCQLVADLSQSSDFLDRARAALEKERRLMPKKSADGG